ncbi:F-box domain-containing protein [Periconia macrospinosa]|uniref:F-box domain-containing protein n=1 Tax=Periconia macrospinosa TaxID=97972 RepID=A0A2V1DHW7_9PLEO|nr:F-box domain-containing protein [Periconia macrospinosa]
MIHLPDEIILQIVAYLEPEEVVNLQHVCRHLLNLARDNSIWKQLCFDHSAAERRRRRLQSPPDIDPHLAELIRAANNVSGAFPSHAYALNALDPDLASHQTAEKRRAALLANWDPTYVGEKVNFYEEFIQRHAPYSIRWFEKAKHGHEDDNLHREATGAGILYSDEGIAERLIAPLEDGSISIWDASASSEHEGKIIARTGIGLLANKGSDLDYDTRLRQSQTIMTETGAVECVSVDSRQKKAFFAVQNMLNEVDLQTLQVVSKTPYPFPITALSESRHPTPLTVGTNWTLHLHDTRKPAVAQAEVKCELIGGPTTDASSRLDRSDFGGHLSLTQPGPLSILHLPSTREWDGNGDIWVGGRFTSFLNFDRRFFPRLRGTVHSGARVSCLTALPYPFIPHELHQQRPSTSAASRLYEAKKLPGYTLIAAGEYKGKGSLELYGLSSEPARSIDSSDSRTTRNNAACYQNRQTASSSKLLSVAPHGTRLVFADGDGNLKWVERDASTPVRHFNINDPDLQKSTSHSTSTHPSSSSSSSPPTATAAATSTVFETPLSTGDIVQKILPSISPSLLSNTSSSAQQQQHAVVPLNQNNILVWTGDGRLGVVGFGRDDVFLDAVERLDGVAEDVGEEEERVREREREYGAEMRRALERQAREARWLRGYGL